MAARHLFSFLISTFLISSTISDRNRLTEPVVCGGFIKLDPSLSGAQVNLESVSIGLISSSDGLVRFNAKANAHNGYFFMPVYESGTYRISIMNPTGWRFEPSQHSIEVKNAESCKREFNFMLTGFSLLGRVQTLALGQSQDPKSSNLRPIPGPKGLKITYSLESSAGSAAIAQANTDEKGEFLFEGVKPGKYLISIEAPEYDFVATSLKVVVTNDNVNISFGTLSTTSFPAFTYRGVSVQGRVVGDRQTKSPMPNVEMLLCSNVPPSITLSFAKPKCNQPSAIPEQISALIPPNCKVFCSLKSDAEGKFNFGGIPSGSYTLLPYYVNENTLFDILPKQYKFEISNSHLVINEEFYISGFSIRGRVLYVEPDTAKTKSVSPSNTGISRAQIRLQSVLDARNVYTTSTNDNGEFTVSGVLASEYAFTINAETSGAQFEPFKLNISPSNSQLPAFIADRLRVCGTVFLHPNAIPILDTLRTSASGSSGPGIRQVMFKNLEAKESSGIVKSPFTTTVSTDSIGKFCAFLPGGKTFAAHVQVSPEEGQLGLVFKPSAAEIKLVSPMSDGLSFSQVVFSLTLQLHCLEACGSEQIQLSSTSSKAPTSGSALDAAMARLARTDHVSSTSAQPNLASFTYTLPFRGSYVLELLPANSAWFWESTTHRLEISGAQTQLPLVQFKHLGYKVTLLSSHYTHATYQLMAGNEVDVKLKPTPKLEHLELIPGANSFIVYQPGTYRLTPESLCFRFMPSVLEIHTDSLPRLVQVEANSVLLNVNVENAVTLPGSSDELHLQDLRIQLAFSDHQDNLQAEKVEPLTEFAGAAQAESQGQAVNETTQKKPPAKASTKWIKTLYKFSFWLDLVKDSFELRPQSTEVLFEPASLSFTRESLGLDNKCPAMKDTLRFNTVEALIITGSTNPPVSDANVHVTLTLPSSLPGEKQTLEQKTDSNGMYRLGPIAKSLQFQVQLSKPGYFFSASGPSRTDFLAVKLAEIRLLILNEKQQPLKGALVSLSSESDASVRAHKFTAADGMVSFQDLKPDAVYYLSALLKEYEFEPNTLVVRLPPASKGAPASEGAETEQVNQMLAKRTAYSLYGLVYCSYGGAPESGLMVVASPASPGQAAATETSITDVDGNFRLSGLKADSTYKVSVKYGAGAGGSPTSGAHIERLIPPQRIVQVAEADIRDLIFLSVPRPQFLEFSVYVQLDPSFPLNSPPSGSVPVSTLHSYNVLDPVSSQRMQNLFANVYLYVLRESTREVLARHPLRHSLFFTADALVPIDEQLYIVHLEQNPGSGPAAASTSGVPVGGIMSGYFAGRDDLFFRANVTAKHMDLVYHPKVSYGLWSAHGERFATKSASWASYANLQSDLGSGKSSTLRTILSLVFFSVISLIIYLVLTSKPNQTPSTTPSFGSELVAKYPFLGRLASAAASFGALFGSLKGRIDSIIRGPGGGRAHRGGSTSAQQWAARSRQQRVRMAARELTPSHSDSEGLGGARQAPQPAKLKTRKT